MEIRGERRCRDCGERWSYYETGSVECPACGSMRSVGTDDRTRHTASPVELDLTAVRNLVDDRPLAEVAGEAKPVARRYVSRAGFIDAGDLRPLDETYLAAQELVHVAGVLERALELVHEEQLYFLALLRGADQGERPAAAEVPDSLTAARGLAYANAVDDYRRDLAAWAGDTPELDGPLDRLDAHVRRVRALDGAVDPEEAEHLVAAARELGEYLHEDDEGALATAKERLAQLG